MVLSHQIRWGILGPGFVAGLFAEDLARVEGARCVAVASRDAGRARAFAERHGVTRYYDDYGALAADPEVDVVYVATPHSHHFEHAKRMLAGGKAVLVEKPFTMTASQAADLIDDARVNGLFLMEAMWTLCNPLLRLLVQRIAAGDIGVPRAFSATIGPLGGIPRGHRVEDPTLGGSFMRECMVYPLSILTALAPDLAKADEIISSSLVTEREVDTYSSVTLRSASGIATLSGGHRVGTAGAGLSALHLVGDRGWLQIDDSLFNPGRASLSCAGAPIEILCEQRSADRYRWEIEEVGRCLRAREAESKLVPLNLTLEVMRLLERCLAATKSLRYG